MDRISEASPMIGLAGAVLAVLYVAIAGPAILTSSQISVVAATASIILGLALIWLSVIDLKTLRLPDAITIPLVAVGLALAAVGWAPTFLWRLAGAAGGYAAIWVIGMSYEVWRGRQGIGLGDAKLLAAAGAWLGLEGVPTTLLYGCLAALLFVAGRHFAGRPVAPDEKLPFGPFLAIGLWLVWLYGPLV